MCLHKFQLFDLISIFLAESPPRLLEKVLFHENWRWKDAESMKLEQQVQIQIEIQNSECFFKNTFRVETWFLIGKYLNNKKTDRDQNSNLD